MFRKTVTVFSSLKLTVGILLSLGALIGYATFFEVDASSGAIRRDFYRTPGFLGILAMLGVNLAACTAKRAPYRPHQIGYVTTHGGLMMILVGSILTFYGGVEGMLPLAEKGVSPAEATQEVFFRTDAPPDLEVAYREGDRETRLGRFPVAPAVAESGRSAHRLGWIFFILGVIAGVLFLLRIWEKGDWYRPVPFVFLGLALLGCTVRVLRPPAGDLPRFSPSAGIEVSVVESLPHAGIARAVRGGGSAGNPAIRVALELEGISREERWLFLKESGRSHFQAGPLLVAFVPQEDLAGIFQTIAEQSEGALARLVPGETPTQVWVKAAKEGWHAVGGGLSVRTDAFFPDLEVDPDADDPDERFATKSQDPRAPAVLFRARRDEGGEEGLFLARAGEGVAERVSGTLPPPEGIEYRFDPRAYLGFRLPMVLLAPKETEPGSFGYLATSRSGDHEVGTVRAGEALRYPFMPMPLSVRVAEAHERAWEETRLAPDPDTNAPPGLRVRIDRGGRIRETAVLLDGGPGEVHFEGEPPVGFRIDYRRGVAPLGFSVTLEDFRKVDYPGTERASSYESDVSVTDGPESFRTTVKVNHPLDREGFRLFQSSYMTDGRGREISVFAVARDPGARLVYLGFLVFGVGLVLIFYLKPFLLARGL